MPDAYLEPDPWPWPGDSPVGEIQRIARSYRSLAEHLIKGVVVDPLRALELEDAEWQRLGHHWVAPTDAPQPDQEQWLSVRDVAHYVSQYYPCSEKNVHDWIHRGLVTSRQVMNGRRVEKVEVLWGSVIEMDQDRTQRRRASRGSRLAERITS